MERVHQHGLSTEIDLGFDETKVLSQEELANLKETRPEMQADNEFHRLSRRGKQTETEEKAVAVKEPALS